MSRWRTQPISRPCGVGDGHGVLSAVQQVQHLPDLAVERHRLDPLGQRRDVGRLPGREGVHESWARSVPT